MYHQRYSTPSEVLSDAEWSLANKINAKQNDMAYQISLLCQISVQKEDEKTIKKIFDQLSPQCQKNVKDQLIITSKRKAEDKKIIEQLKKNKFYSLACQEQFYVIKICYTKDKQQKRYIHQVIDMALQSATQKSANRIYSNLPSSYREYYFEPQMRRRFPNNWDQWEGNIRLKRKPTGLTCKDRFIKFYIWLKDIIK